MQTVRKGLFIFEIRESFSGAFNAGALMSKWSGWRSYKMVDALGWCTILFKMGPINRGSILRNLVLLLVEGHCRISSSLNVKGRKAKGWLKDIIVAPENFGRVDLILYYPDFGMAHLLGKNPVLLRF
ncbi:hypothetical protein CDAR_221001 [Caerostris darwini]|uniref:Uncharacterized protein n=1 Tax=Caerostris darwini TaxID=1538125 RepID=A0AAV4P753_9ARAC|nr:hypothetical protein CDAR_221001 [Caerostris darwini]